jgi:hypothetical protein
MQGLQIALLGRLYGDEVHCGPLNGFENRLCVPVVVLVALQKRLHVLRRKEPHVMAEFLKTACGVMCTGACLHADQTPRNIRETLQQLRAGSDLTQLLTGRPSS